MDYVYKRKPSIVDHAVPNVDHYLYLYVDNVFESTEQLRTDSHRSYTLPILSNRELFCDRYLQRNESRAALLHVHGPHAAG